MSRNADPRSRQSLYRGLAGALADPTPIVRMVWASLAGVPLLWVVEYTGPRALSLVLRAAWVVLVLAIVAYGAVLLVRRSDPSS